MIGNGCYLVKTVRLYKNYLQLSGGMDIYDLVVAIAIGLAVVFVLFLIKKFKKSEKDCAC